MKNKRSWIALALVVVCSFAALGWMGREIYRQAPPIPERVVTQDGALVFTAAQIQMGQQVWQSTGGQQLGSIWGHGAYQAPDWSADWLHREATGLLDRWAQARSGVAYAALDAEAQAALRSRLTATLRKNTFDAATGTLTLSADRADVVREVAGHYDDLFGSAAALEDLREAYAMPKAAVPDSERRKALTAFFFWTSWSCAANRPGDSISYTNDWPPEPLLGHAPTPASILWTLLSIATLLAGVGGLAWFMAARRKDEEHAVVPARDPLLAMQPTPSMLATRKYFWTVVALMLVQVVLGAITAHYGVEGRKFYGFALADILPYVVTRTWHTQIGVFWIATAWVATGLYIAPAVSGYEPPYQRLLVNALFGCLLVIVVGGLRRGAGAGARGGPGPAGGAVRCAVDLGIAAFCRDAAHGGQPVLGGRAHAPVRCAQRRSDADAPRPRPARRSLAHP